MKLIIECTLDSTRVNELLDAEYKKVRPVVVFPEI
nr:MAG TPA: hypothetical protein [Bacteriophage sp.]